MISGIKHKESFQCLEMGWEWSSHFRWLGHSGEGLGLSVTSLCPLPRVKNSQTGTSFKFLCLVRIWFLTEDVGNPAGAHKIQPMVVLTTSTWSLNTFYVFQDNLSGEFGSGSGSPLSFELHVGWVPCKRIKNIFVPSLIHPSLRDVTNTGSDGALNSCRLTWFFPAHNWCCCCYFILQSLPGEQAEISDCRHWT